MLMSVMSHQKSAPVRRELQEAWSRGEERSARLATWLHRQGLRRGDSVALLATNSLEHYVVYWAAMRSALARAATGRYRRCSSRNSPARRQRA